VCDYLAELQQALNFISELNEGVSYTNFVIVPESLNNTLHQYFDAVALLLSFVLSVLLPRSSFVLMNPEHCPPFLSPTKNKTPSDLRPHV
jgi:hypothetical protein